MKTRSLSLMLSRVLPPAVRARMDLARPRLATSWGGPMNGQIERQRIMWEVAAALDVRVVVETGTFRGTTTEFLADVFRAPVFSAELDPRFANYSSQRLAHRQDIRILNMDSRRMLEKLADDHRIPREGVLFYLDAHWGVDLPLVGEIRTIATGWDDWIAVIDDFQVPNDPGYAHDTDSDGRPLGLELLSDVDLEGVEVFWPAAPSDRESGARRGCGILATATAAEGLRQVPSLRVGHQVAAG